MQRSAAARACAVTPRRVSHPRDNCRLRTARVMLEVLRYVDAHPVCTLTEVTAGLGNRVCWRTVLRHLVALEALGAVESRRNSELGNHRTKYFESTGLIRVAEGGLV